MPELDIQPLDIQPIQTQPTVQPRVPPKRDEATLNDVITGNLPEPEPSFLESVWDTISSPLWEGPARAGRTLSEDITTPTLSDAPTGEGGFEDYLSGVKARAKGFAGGALEGIGNLISGVTSPIDLTAAALTGGSSLAAKTGFRGASQALRTGAKLASAPVAAHGAATIVDPETSLTQKAFGVAELAGGAAGMKGVPAKKGTAAKVAGATDTVLDIKPIKGIETPAPVTTAASTSPTTKGPTKLAEGIYDEFSKMREVPTGTTYKVSPDQMSRKKLAEAIKLGFEYMGIDEKTGRIIIKKTRESPKPDLVEVSPGQLGPKADIKKASPIVEAFNLPRGLMASVDFSAPLRQGLPLIHKKEFWKAMPQMFKAWSSEDGFRAIQQEIANRPAFRKTIGADGKIKPSFAEKAGLSLTDLTDLSKREEAIMSTWAERVPGMGRVVRKSNRAYVAFLNRLRADTFDSLIKDTGAFGVSPRTNLPLARALASFVNTASGRGSLGKLESSAVALNTILFSPRLIASRLKMLNPAYYIMAPKPVRKEGIKSLLAIATVGNTIGQLVKMAGGEVGNDPNSSDFGKAKIGNTRIDPYGGFQQYIVAANRLLRPSFAKVPGMEGGIDSGILPIDLATGYLGEGGQSLTSSTSSKEYDLWNPVRPFDPTHMDVIERFARGKTHPVLNFAWGLLKGQKEMSGDPMNFSTMNPFENAMAQRFIPILMQDLYELAQSDELPAPVKTLIGGAATFGMGHQTYE